MKLEKIRKKKERYVIGLMSGTSCDGIDAVLVRIKGTSTQLAFKLIKMQNFPFTPIFRTRLLSPRGRIVESPGEISPPLTLFRPTPTMHSSWAFLDANTPIFGKRNGARSHE